MLGKEKKSGVENTVEEYLVQHQEEDRGRRRGPCQPLWRQTKCFEADTDQRRLANPLPLSEQCPGQHCVLRCMTSLFHFTTLSMLNTQQILSTIFIIVKEKPTRWFQRIFNQRKTWKRTNCHLQYFKLELLVVRKDTGRKAFSTLTCMTHGE